MESFNQLIQKMPARSVSKAFGIPITAAARLKKAAQLNKEFKGMVELNKLLKFLERHNLIV